MIRVNGNAVPRESCAKRAHMFPSSSSSTSSSWFSSFGGCFCCQLGCLVWLDNGDCSPVQQEYRMKIKENMKNMNNKNKKNVSQLVSYQQYMNQSKKRQHYRWWWPARWQCPSRQERASSCSSNTSVCGHQKRPSWTGLRPAQDRLC